MNEEKQVRCDDSAHELGALVLLYLLCQGVQLSGNVGTVKKYFFLCVKLNPESGST